MRCITGRLSATLNTINSFSSSNIYIYIYNPTTEKLVLKLIFDFAPSSHLVVPFKMKFSMKNCPVMKKNITQSVHTS